MHSGVDRMVRSGWLVVLTTFAGALWHPELAAQAAVPCDHADADPWIAEAGVRLMEAGSRTAALLEGHGDPDRCEGVVTQRFEGVTYGSITLTFTGGVEYSIATMPFETTIQKLVAVNGFPDEERLRERVRLYMDGVGFHIRWDDPTIEEDNGSRTEMYRDPEPGMNALVSFVRRDDRLVRVGISWSL